MATYIGELADWRAAFVTMGAPALVVLIALAAPLLRLPAEQEVRLGGGTRLFGEAGVGCRIAGGFRTSSGGTPPPIPNRRVESGHREVDDSDGLAVPAAPAPGGDLIAGIQLDRGDGDRDAEDGGLERQGQPVAVTTAKESSCSYSP
ncbi:hypothetical protein ACFXKR_25455 [Streptomyces violascens]|uniref:hypothetical protein n=1 Tax=Streptomyces violascens TaxID=67381 RepID=UPI00368A1683